MRTSSQVLLTFLLNACWQIALIAALASFGSWLLRHSVARYRHWVWAGALCLSFLVPAFTASQTLFESVSEPNRRLTFLENDTSPILTESASSVSFNATRSSAYLLNQTLGLALLAVYFCFLLYRGYRLLEAWRNTKAIRRETAELESDDRITAVIERCELAFKTTPGKVRVCRSETLPVPVTIGLFQPVIILPEPLLREGNIELLTSAIGHEFVHVARRDYLLNFIYELVFVTVSFHPAAALLRRRVKQTRELTCDELVAERILNAEVYARSLVKLAGSAPPLRRLSVTTTVGIADADILEARIMSLLKKPELKTRWTKLLLTAVAVMLLVPCAAAGAFALRFDVETQDPAPQERKVRTEALTQQDKEKLETMEREARSFDAKVRVRSSDPAVVQEMERKRQVELEMRDITEAALVKLARINMDQAIQIATSQQPGKVLLCSLGARGWEEPGKLSKDGVVFYQVVIADEVNPGSTHIFVNAIDGTVMKTEKSLPRKMRSADVRQ
jgi:beta-lactamase regulating signal transducer with metallopeptidase domain